MPLSNLRGAVGEIDAHRLLFLPKGAPPCKRASPSHAAPIRTQVIFDFYFTDVSETAREHNRASVEIGERIQQEDLDICESVQRGLQSRAYSAGRLSLRREAGEHLFHRLLYGDLKIGLA